MIRVALIFIVYILGPALILVWAVKRYKSGTKPDFVEIVAVVLAISLIGVISFTMYNTVSDEDRENANHIVQSLVQRYHFPVKAKFQDVPAVFGEAQGYTIVISIYGVTDPIEQQKIVEIAQDLRRQWNSKPLDVKFFQQEIWEQKPDGSRRAARNKETLLHKYHIE